MSPTPSVPALSGAAARRGPPDIKLVLALAAVWVLWGSTYYAMRIAVTWLPPFLMAGSRFVSAGGALLAILRARGERLPDARTWMVALPVGALLFVCGNGFVVMAEQELPSSVAAVVCATTPLILSGLGTLRGERPTRVELIGLVSGFAGVVVLGMGSSLGGTGYRGLLILLAPLGWAVGSLVARAESARIRGAGSGLGASGAYMVVGGCWMLLVGMARGERLGPSLAWQGIAAWAYLAVFGSLIGFTAYAWLLANARPAVAMSYAYVNPVIAVLLGAALGGEHVGASTLAATVLIGGGVMATIVLGKRGQFLRSPAQASTLDAAPATAEQAACERTDRGLSPR